MPYNDLQLQYNPMQALSLLNMLMRPQQKQPAQPQVTQPTEQQLADGLAAGEQGRYSGLAALMASRNAGAL